jgi:hypothetical protein
MHYHPKKKKVLCRCTHCKLRSTELWLWNRQGVFLTKEAPVVYFTGLGRFPATGPAGRVLVSARSAILGHEIHAARGPRAPNHPVVQAGPGARTPGARSTPQLERFSLSINKAVRIHEKSACRCQVGPMFLWPTCR